MSAMITASSFVPAWWLPGPHLQTIWPNLVRRLPQVQLRRERMELDDGDFLDLDWTTNTDGPIVLILHGLEGSSRSHYAAGLLQALHARGWRGVLLHARGCSGEPNRLARRYHAGDTGDIERVYQVLCQREPNALLATVGYSLGGSMLLNWLAERAEAPRVAAAVAVSVPFDLDATATRLNRGFSRVYQYILLSSVCRALRRKHARMPDHPLAHTVRQRPRSFRQFDDVYTAPLHNFDSATDYYRRSSTRAKLKRIRTPLLLLQAADDPFMGAQTLPTDAELPQTAAMELSRSGGHVGFVAGSPRHPHYWLETRIPEYLASVLT